MTISEDERMILEQLMELRKLDADLARVTAERDRLREGLSHAIGILAFIQPRRYLMKDHIKRLLEAEKYMTELYKSSPALESESKKNER
jgi:hypothetical protein